MSSNKNDERSNAERLTVLRDELLARNEIERLLRRGEDPPHSLTVRLREASVDKLLEKISILTSTPGGDDRVELAAANPAVRDFGDSVALICSRADLAAPTPQRATWQLIGAYFLCDGQRFSGEPGLESRTYTPATGFLVGTSGSYLLTAKHVAMDNNGGLIPELYCVFGYRMIDNAPVQFFPPSDVVRVSKLIAHGGHTEGEDWALVKLEASTGRPGLPLRDSGTTATLDSVISIGYPHGLPAKTGKGAIRDVSSPLYLADLDIGGGNSGSPVIAVNGSGKPLRVEGIIRGALPDLRPDLMPVDERGGCRVWVSAIPQDDPEYWAGFVPIATIMANTRFKQAVFP